MTRSLSIVFFAVVILPLSSMAHAQHAVVVDDGLTDYRTRGELPWGSTGWIATRYAFDKQGNGIGPSGIAGLQFEMTDENCTTPEASQFALFEQDPTLPPGSPGTVPDANRVLAQTAVFQSPAGPAQPCSWIYTVTFPAPVGGVRTLDLFPAAYLDAGAGWNLEGPSGQCSALNSGTSPELPNRSPDPQTSNEITREYGLYMLGGTGPSLAAGSATWPLLSQSFLNRLMYVHSTRAGVFDASGFLASNAAVSPDNFGWTDYLDAANRGGHTPARRDEPIWQGRHDAFGGPTTVGMMLLGKRLHRTLAGAPINLGFGVLELDPTDPLFLPSVRGDIAGLVQLPVLPGVQRYQMTISLQSLGFAPMLHATNADIYCQELRIDLVTGQASLGSLDTHSFRR